MGLGDARRSKGGASTRAANQSARGRSRSLLCQAFRCTRPGVNGGYPETGCGKLSCEEVEHYVKSDRFIQLDGSHVTTDQAKVEEEQLLDLVRGGWDTCEPIGQDFALDLGELTDEQREALEHIMASKDLVMDVSGIAGAGKSHLLKQVEKATIAVGKTMAILSPSD